MTLRLVFRLVAGLAFAMIVAMSWATPSEAHAGHGGPAAATQKADQPGTPEPVAVAAKQAAEAGSAECGGHMNKNAADTTSCCSNTCHAAMPADMARLQAVAVAATILPTLAAPLEFSGPVMHLKRPPRPSVASVG